MTHIHFGRPTTCTAFRHRFLALSYFERLSRRTSTRKRSLCRFGPAIPPLFENEWVEMGDPAPLRRRTHGGAGTGALALIKPLPPEAVAGRPGFTRAKRPRPQSPPADRWAAIQHLAPAPSLLLGATSPIRNSKEPQFRIKGQLWREKYQSALLDCELHFRPASVLPRMSAVGTKRPAVALAEGLLIEALLKHARVCRPTRLTLTGLSPIADRNQRYLSGAMNGMTRR